MLKRTGSILAGLSLLFSWASSSVAAPGAVETKGSAVSEYIEWCVLHQGVRLFRPSSQDLRSPEEIRVDCLKRALNSPAVYNTLRLVDGQVIAGVLPLIHTKAKEGLEWRWEWVADTYKHDLLFLDMLITGEMDLVRDHFRDVVTHAPPSGSGLLPGVTAAIVAKMPHVLAGISDPELADMITKPFFHELPQARWLDEDLNEDEDLGNVDVRRSVNIRIVRDYQDDRSTFGRLFVDDREVARTLENSATLIPERDYSAIMRYSSPAGHVLDGDFLIELVGVPGMANVQIHIGNQPQQSSGCILVGTQIGSTTVLDTHTGTVSEREGVQASRIALGRLRTAFYGTPHPNFCPALPIRVSLGQSPNYRPFTPPAAPARPATAPDTHSANRERAHDSFRSEGADERHHSSDTAAELREFDRVDHSHQEHLRAGEHELVGADSHIDSPK